MFVFQIVIILMVDVTQCMVVINQNIIGQGESMNRGIVWIVIFVIILDYIQM
jgi:hypothetical protein